MEDLGLEPIDPFTEDVFAGLDDHPSGLWHPTLSPVPPAAATHHQDVPQASNACASASSSCHESLALPYDDMLPAPELPIDLMAHLGWHNQQAGQHQQQLSQQQQQHQHPSRTNADAGALEQHCLGKTGTAHNPEHALLAQEAAVTSPELQPACSTQSTSCNRSAGDAAVVFPLAGKVAPPDSIVVSSRPGPPSAGRQLLSASVTDLNTSRLQDAVTTPVPTAAVADDCAALLPGSDPAAGDTDSTEMPCSSSSTQRQCTASSTEQPPEAPSLPVAIAADEADSTADSAACALASPAAAEASSPSSQSSVPDIDDVSEEQTLLGTDQQPLHSTYMPIQEQQQQQQQQGYEQQQQKEQSRQGQQQCDTSIAPSQLLCSGQHSMQQPPHLQLQQVQDAGHAAHQVLCSSTHLDCFDLRTATSVHVSEPLAALTSTGQLVGLAAAASASALCEAPLSAAGAAGTKTDAGDAELHGLCMTAAGALGDAASPNTSWHSCMTSASHSSALRVLSAHAGHPGQAGLGAGSSAAPARSGVGLATLLPSEQQQVSGVCRAALCSDSIRLPAAAHPLASLSYQLEQRQQQQQPEDDMPAIQAGAQDDEFWQDVFPPSLGSSPATSGGFAALAAHSAAVAAAQAAARRAAAGTADSTGISSSPATAAGFTAITAQHLAAVQPAAGDTEAGDGNHLGCSPATAAGFTAIDRGTAAAAVAAQAAAGGALSSSPATAAGFTTVDAPVAPEHAEGEGGSTSSAASAGSVAATDAQSAVAAAAVGGPEAAAAAEGAELSTSPAPADGSTAVETSLVAALNAAAAGAASSIAAEADAAAAATAEEHDEVHEGHGVYYAAADAAAGAHPQRFSPGSSTGGAHNPYQLYTAAGQGIGLPFVPYPGQYPGQVSAAASTYVLRQSEMVDLSLSTSLHPGQQQQQQHVRPGWLTAHQSLPPAAAQAVERAVVALNDSYFYHGRPEQGLGGSSSVGNGLPGPGAAGHAAHAAGSSVGADAAAASGLGASGVIGMAIRRAGMRQQWSHAHTHPQQDQQARHRLPSQHATSASGPSSGWHGPAVLGQWFSSTVQQPLSAATGRVAAGVGQRLGEAASMGRKTATDAVRHSSSNGAARVAGSSSAGGAAAAASQPGSGGNRGAGGWDVGWGADSFEDAVLVERTPDMPQSLQDQEDEAFRGLLFLGGRDAHGRPVVIVNTDAIPAGHNPAPRDAALAYILNKLTPIVTKGPYVLVMVAFQHGPQFRLLPGVWCVRAYHSLPRAFRKNVKHVILLQPSFMVRAGLALLYPFVSSKAHAKVKQVQRLLEIETATRGEVQVPHLGEPFLTALQQLSRQASAPPAAPHGSSAPGMGGSRTVPVPGAMQR